MKFYSHEVEFLNELKRMRTKENYSNPTEMQRVSNYFNKILVIQKISIIFSIGDGGDEWYNEEKKNFVLHLWAKREIAMG